MKISFPKKIVKPALSILLLILVSFAGVKSHLWLPATQSWVKTTIARFRENSHDEHAVEDADDPHAGHAHAEHDDANSLELSQQALKNIGLTPEWIQPVKLETFHKSMSIPGRVVERPGRTRVQVATPLTGVVMHVHALEGETVEAGTMLFQIRLTHEDLVQSQTDFLKTLGELDVEQREIQRLQDVTESGAIAKKFLLEREYAKDKLIALQNAQREALKLHGLSEAQIDQISLDRKLLRELQLFAPSPDDHSEDELKLTEGGIRRVSFQKPDTDEVHPHLKNAPLLIQKLNVHKGQSIRAGETLCVLADYQELFIEGMAFEQDIELLREASRNEWKVSAIFDRSADETQVVNDLNIAYLSNEIHTDSRALHFYVDLPNQIVSEKKLKGSRFIGWQFFPGQRLQLKVPIQVLTNQIVLPVDAVARSGVEFYVFQQNGDHFDRVPVHVLYRDQFSAVIANDGSIFPGDLVALRGAHQMQMALKNKAGGAVDPHAGHNH